MDSSDIREKDLVRLPDGRIGTVVVLGIMTGNVYVKAYDYSTRTCRVRPYRSAALRLGIKRSDTS